MWENRKRQTLSLQAFSLFYLLLTRTYAFRRPLRDAHSPKTPGGCVCLEHLKTGYINNPVAYIPIGNGKFLLAEQAGMIYIYFGGKSLKRKLVLDMTAKSAFTGNQVDERGLLSVAIHPDFKNNNLFYVHYIYEGTHRAIVSEFVFSRELPLNISSERRILADQRQTDGREHGGQIFFGIDKMLYISFGSGTGKLEKSAQNKSELTGKILRIDVDNVHKNRDDGKYFERQYSIPTDNPFVNTPGAREEIYALGVKNMWRCSTDKGHSQTGYGKGRIFCGDVGHDNYEEINIIKKGGNYGWNLREGYECRQKDKCNETSIVNEVLPIYVYKHDWTRKAVIGGYVYRGNQLPWLNGQYIFADFFSLELFRLKESRLDEWEAAILPYCSPSQCEDGPKRSELMQYIMSLGQDLNGELYLLVTSDLSGSKSKGAVLRLTSQIKNHSHRFVLTSCSLVLGVIMAAAVCL